MKFLRINSRHNDIYFTLQFSRKQRKKKKSTTKNVSYVLLGENVVNLSVLRKHVDIGFTFFMISLSILFYFIFLFFGLSRNIEGEKKCKYKSFLLRHRCCILSTRSDFKRIIIFIKEPDEVLNITKQSIMITDFF